MSVLMVEGCKDWSICMHVCMYVYSDAGKKVKVECAHPDLIQPMNFAQAKSAATKGASMAPSWRTSHHRSSCTSVVTGSIEDGNRPVFACSSKRSSFSFHRSINQAWNSSRVSSGMEDTLKRRQCMWIGAWGCRSKYVERSVKMSWPYCPSLIPHLIPIALQGVCGKEGKGGFGREDVGLTERRRRPKYSRTPNPASHSTLSDKNTSPYSAG